MADKQTKYVEPESYFSKEMRKVLEIGEYAKKSTDKKKSKKVKTKNQRSETA